jgi:hypothetical protein
VKAATARGRCAAVGGSRRRHAHSWSTREIGARLSFDLIRIERRWAIVRLVEPTVTVGVPCRLARAGVINLSYPNIWLLVKTAPRCRSRLVRDNGEQPILWCTTRDIGVDGAVLITVDIVSIIVFR